MPIERCPFSNETCKYYGRAPLSALRREQSHGCYADQDHIVPQRLAINALNAAYIDLEINKQMLCREQHEKKTKAGDEPLPTEREMAEELMRAHKQKSPELHGNLLSQVRRILGQKAFQLRSVEADNDFLTITGIDEETGNGTVATEGFNGC